MAKLLGRPPKDAPSTRMDGSDARELSLPPGRHPLDAVIGVFRDEPLMDALMERVRQSRRAEQAAGSEEAALEDAGSER